MPDPVLHTERLTLRPITAALAATLTAPQTNGFPRADDLSLLAGIQASGDQARDAYVVEHDGVPIGTVGAAGALSPDGDQEIGFGLVVAARGRGLATEAVAAVCARLEAGAGVRRLTAEVQPGNNASMRVLQRLGFVPVQGGSTGHQLLARSAPGLPDVRPHLIGRHVC
ncbi:MAG: GNAT family N-acetyltransferase [Frankiales bacterium]|nr:GNAT family N-acetyltransferase [Frankiales bacterium]